jgi:uncharacterized membrane-anchored protein
MAETFQTPPLLPPDHPERQVLADEVHARPPEPLETPSRATFVAVLVDEEERAHEREHIAALLRPFGLQLPPDPLTPISVKLDRLRFKWERHGEFSSYTCFAAGRSPTPFSEPPAALLPPGWLAGVPGQTIFAAHAKLIPAPPQPPDAAFLALHFKSNIVMGAEIGDGAGLAYTDFRRHEDGFARILVLDRAFTPRQAGRMLQRLFEIEAYRMMSLLALPIARRSAPRILAIERQLAALTDGIATESENDEALLQQLAQLAAEVESSLAASQFRFSACAAYAELVNRRIAELREARLPGLQTIEEFMARRFNPAVATCISVSQRLHGLSERVAQASGLISARVEIVREQQNRALLASMDRRAKQQVRLQQTVEGLSVAAIAYYVAGLVGYVAKALNTGGLHVNVDLIVGAAIPVTAVLVILSVRRARRRIARLEAGVQEKEAD